MLYYGFQNYEAFNQSFGMVRHSNGVCSRKNKVLLAYIKDKGRLHEAAATNRYDFLRLSDMAGLEAVVENEILKSGSEDTNLPYTLCLMGRIYYSALYETDENEGLCEDGDLKSVRYLNRKSGKVFKMKAGKLYRSLVLETCFGRTLPEQVVNYLSEKFATEWQTYAMGKQPKTKVHVNRDFRRIYSSDCCEGDFGSCMTDEDYYGFYENAVDASAAYIENNEGKVIARCIIYNEVKDQDGKARELHTNQAMDAINFADVQDDFRTEYELTENEPIEVVASPYFTTSVYDMTEEITCDYSELDSFVIFICTEGSCKITDDSKNELTLCAGETILLPASTQEVTITPDGRVKLLETYV